MKTGWLMVVLVALVCAAGGCVNAKAQNDQAEADMDREQLLDEYTQFLKEVKWDTPIDFTQDFFRPDEGFRPPDVPQGLGDYRTLPLLLDLFGINELPIPSGATFAGIKLTGEVEPLDELSLAEQNTLMLRFRTSGNLGNIYNAMTQLRLAPMMALSGQSELSSIRDIVECERGKQPLVTVTDYVGWVRSQRRQLPTSDYQEWFRQNVLPYYANWVTGGLFEPWHEEFSPGNGIIREITDEADRAQLHELAVKQASEKGDEYDTGFLEENPDDVAYFVYRLYGEDKVIKECVAWCLRSRASWGEPLRREHDEVIAILARRLEENVLTDEGLEQYAKITDRWEWAKHNPYAEWCENCAEGIDERYEEMMDELQVAQHGEFPEIGEDWSLSDLPLNDSLVYWENLTDGEERTLAFRENISSSFTDYLQDLAGSDYEAVTSWEQLAEVVLQDLIRFRDETWIQTVSSKRSQRSIDCWLSPITRRTFEPWHREWSRGNGYIIQIAEEDMLARLIKLYEKAIEEEVVPTRLHPFYYERYPHRLRFYYVRLYGEEEGSIISEGIWSAWPLNPMLD